MARFVPAKPAHNSSEAESWLFRKLSYLSDDYVVLHSLGLIRHDHKNWSEIDFTIVGPEGVFLIEVKGGIISRENGDWYTTTKNGKKDSLGRGPFFQVGGAEAATRRFLEDRLEWLNKVTMGYWVYTPDCRLDVDDLGVNAECFFDASSSGTDANHLVGRMRSFWANRRGRTARLSAHEVQLVVNELCADIYEMPSLRRRINDVAERIHAATEEQQKILDAAVEMPRLIIKGPAGSGKSTIALIDARFHASAGSKVLLLCQGIGLRDLFRLNIEHVPNVTILSMAEIGLIEEISPTFDVLIIDEAQDVLEKIPLSRLEKSLIGGVENGIWRVFLDPFQGNVSAELDDSMERLGQVRPGVLNMNRNVRTTSQIAVASSALAFVDRITGGIDGPEVEFVYHEDYDIENEIQNCVDSLVSEEVRHEEIVIIVPDELRRRQFEMSFGVRIATTSQMKGLESVAVIFVGLAEIQNVESRKSAYISCTRATTILKVLFPRSLQSEISRAYAALARRNPTH
jgi:hypothetical protein